VKEAERRFAAAAPEIHAFIIGAILRRWVDLEAPVTFRAFVRTGVSWMWSGGAGALVAVWPSPSSPRAPRDER
jgi:hypothetical protein